jgi:general secretion pathway protein J
MNSRTHGSGLTLLEMLVVLTLLSMVSALMFQGYGYMLGSYQRIERRQSAGLNQLLAGTWFRGTLENLVAHYDGSGHFVATETRVAGSTFSPLLSRDGVPGQFRWELVSEVERVQLYYHEQGQDLLVSEWGPGTTASFRFLNTQGQWLARWGADKDAQLPEAIQLRLDNTVEVLLPTITAVVQTRKSQRIGEIGQGDGEED